MTPGRVVTQVDQINVRTRLMVRTARAARMIVVALLVVAGARSTVWAQTFSATGSLNVPRRGHQAVLLADGRVIVSGGFGNTAGIAQPEIYNPVTGFWSLTGNNVI